MTAQNKRQPALSDNKVLVKATGNMTKSDHLVQPCKTKSILIYYLFIYDGITFASESKTTCGQATNNGKHMSHSCNQAPLPVGMLMYGRTGTVWLLPYVSVHA